VPIIRQMPGLYLRGSIANITMVGLSPEEKAHIELVFDHVIHHEEMVRHKQKVMKEFGVTIRADYADDRAAAEQEFNIAVWRGLVSIFYHRTYEFECTNCGATASLTQRGKPKPIDRMVTPCPVCHMAEIVDPGCSDHNPGDLVNYTELQERYKLVGFGTPTFKSCIRPIPKEKKYDNPDEIIGCPKQLKRFFGEFVWNYFRQQIKENKRKEHNKTPVEITGPADQMIVELILSLCSRMNVDYNRHHKVEPVNGRYTIDLLGLLTPPEFSIELALVRVLAESHGVVVTTTAQAIEIAVHPNPPTIKVSIVRAAHVTIIDNQLTVTDDEENSGFSISQVSYKTVGARRMDQDDHVQTTDIREAATRTRAALPDGDCQSVYDIYCQIGPVYDKFSEVYGNGTPRINHIADFLGITARAVKQCRDVIQVQCLANDFVPAST